MQLKSWALICSYVLECSCVACMPMYIFPQPILVILTQLCKFGLDNHSSCYLANVARHQDICDWHVHWTIEITTPYMTQSQNKQYTKYCYRVLSLWKYDFRDGIWVAMWFRLKHLVIQKTIHTSMSFKNYIFTYTWNREYSHAWFP